MKKPSGQNYNLKNILKEEKKTEKGELIFKNIY
jgi:hypothetical protein